ncbi:MAG TPA: 3-alpha domain-containing protein, partial [Solirubrobacter sp.]|nr:3-alpha domain-containing protein [Solirubrobacter sp.]
MDEPAMPSLLVAHKRPGFYLRVLEEGPVEAGDSIVKVADGPERLSVVEIDALLYLPGKSRPLLERAPRVAALSDGWKGSFRELLAEGGRGSEPAWAGFQPLRVAEVRRESATVSSFRLVATGAGGPSPRAAAGQYLTLRLRPDAATPALVRSYSLSDVPGERGYRISVRREGAASRYLHEHVKVGDVIDVAAPRGSFPPARGHTPGRADQRRGRPDAGARDAPRPRALGRHPSRLVGSRRAQPRRARLRARGRRAARRPGGRSPR